MNEPSNKAIGKPLDRVDGRLKVTGAARYAAEFPLKNMAHAVLVQSAIAKGRITNIDTSAAQKSPGVLAVITHLNAPKLASPQSGGGDSSGGDAQVTAANAQSGKAVLVVKILLKTQSPFCNLTKSIFTGSILV